MIPSNEMKERFPGTSDGTWAQHRYKGTGPAYVKVGRKVFYREEDIAAWVQSNTHQRTDERRVSA